MKIIQPSVIIENQDWSDLLKRIETKGRVCYKSEEKITDHSAEVFVESLARRGHMSVLEHSAISVKFIVDRGVTHEIVRHRLASYSQESTRYCNYGNDDGGITLIEPFWVDKTSDSNLLWVLACSNAEQSYLRLLSEGWTPQEARSVLPNSLKTEIWMTANIREWLHFFGVRSSKAAHPQMRQVAIPLLLKFQELLSPVFVGMGYDNEFPAIHYAKVGFGDETPEI